VIGSLGYLILKLHIGPRTSGNLSHDSALDRRIRARASLNPRVVNEKFRFCRPSRIIGSHTACSKRKVTDTSASKVQFFCAIFSPELLKHLLQQSSFQLSVIKPMQFNTLAKHYKHKLPNELIKTTSKYM